MTPTITHHDVTVTHHETAIDLDSERVSIRSLDGKIVLSKLDAEATEWSTLLELDTDDARAIGGALTEAARLMKPSTIVIDADNDYVIPGGHR